MSHYQPIADALRREFPGCDVRVDLYEQGGAVVVSPENGPIRLAIWRPDGQMVDARTMDEAVQELKA